MKIRSAHSAVFLALALTACSPAVMITSRSTGQQGTGTVENIEFGNSGKMTVTLGAEQFTGTWLAVRDTGLLGFSSDAGTGNAILRSNQGNNMRCEFKYSMVTYTAIGVCVKNDQEVFDLQASMV